MDTLQFLSFIQGSEGDCAVFVKRGSAIQQIMFDTQAEAAGAVLDYSSQGWDTYIAVSRFNGTRNKDNVASVKSFWIDLDCGPDKGVLREGASRPDGYYTQKEALEALKNFVSTTGLPIPTVVNSGWGVHAYWVLEEEVAPWQWEVTAKRLKEVCNTQGLYVDNNVFELARVLRMPGTYNYKREEPKLVTVLKQSKPTALDTINEVLGVSYAEPPSTKKRGLTALGAALAQNVDAKFKQIIVRSTPCQQLVGCLKERATLSEPRWFDALSVAKFCSDRDIAIHKLSEEHPDYDPAVVEEKIQHIKGPHTCAEFEKNNPGGCDGCPHKGKITSPISLGKVIARDTLQVDEGETDDEEGDEEEKPVPPRTPRIPWPYFRGKNGGIYAEIETEDDNKEVLVYENDLFVTKLMFDPVHGFVAVFEVSLPMDGRKEFVVSNDKITDKAELRRALSKNGVVAPEERFKFISAYIIAAIRELQQRQKAELMRTQFGWADKDRSFIVGDREITATDIYHSPPSSTTQSLAPFFDPRGTLEAWKEVFALYGRPGLELQAFGALTGFGAPLLKFTGQKGAVINLIHPHSGTGKTTVLRMANSIFGDPEHLLGTPDDTKVGRIIKVGILNNLVNTIDEITNMTPEDASQLLYAYSQGRGKDKAKANANELRENTTTWRTITLASSNASFYEKLASTKHTPDGEMLRLLELKIDYTPDKVISVSEGKEMFDHQLNQNYGWAGEKFIQYVLGNRESVIDAVLKVQKRLDTELTLTQRERNWSAVVAANIAGGIIAKRLGLIDWDMKAIYQAVKVVVEETRREIATTPPTTETTREVLGTYLNSRVNNTLIVDSECAHVRSKMPISEPKGDLLVRYEPDTKRLYITVSDFRKHCVANQINYNGMRREMERARMVTNVISKRLASGSKMITPPVRCLEIDCTHNDFMGLNPVEDVVANAEKTKEETAAEVSQVLDGEE